MTKENEQNYVEYIDAIKSSADKCQEAYWVKIADMKDHLSQTDTLTDKLKKKYLAALAHLLWGGSMGKAVVLNIRGVFDDF